MALALPWSWLARALTYATKTKILAIRPPTFSTHLKTEAGCVSLTFTGLNQVIIGYTAESSATKAGELKSQITALSHKPKAHSVRADLASPEGPAQLAAELGRAIDWSGDGGGFKLDIVVNNAAIAPVLSVSETTPAEFDRVYNLNLRGPVALVHALLPYLNKTGRGRIVNISSIGARAGFKGLSAYCASKGGLEAVTRCWATELGVHGTTANVVSPGPVDTDLMNTMPDGFVDGLKAQTPMQNRLGTVEEIARTVAWLCGPAGSWITGQTICASGGFSYY